MQHFVDIAQFNQVELLELLNSAQDSLEQPVEQCLQNHFVANLFFEPSTRTRCSFEIAAKRLGAKIINLDSSCSSAQKGETVMDTITNLQAMGVTHFIIRHQQNSLVDEVAAHVGDSAHIINAGCGTSQHPSQALLDMLTIQQHKKNFADLSVAIIGDMKHSRVAHSDIAALQILGVHKIHLIAPVNLLPTDIKQTGITVFNNIDEGLADVDVIMTLRMQKERMQAGIIPDATEFFQQYGLTPARLALAKPDAIVMHPGPMNRGVEIANDVADGKQSVILQQVTNGVAARMAILAATVT